MKILLSSYACEPNKGSEPGVGWNWATTLVKQGHEVYVLTRSNNQNAINNAINKSQYEGLYFIYYDLPMWAKFWKKGGRGVRLYYFLWQFFAYFKAKKHHSSLKFNLVHHITFGTIRQPSFMGSLGIPFLLGPLGGGESAPFPLRKSYPLRGYILDLIRDCLNHLVKFDPFMRLSFKNATCIYVKTPESKNYIPKCYHHKVFVQMEIGSSMALINNSDKTPSIEKHLKILFVGRFIYWKGGHLAISAFEKTLKILPDAKLTMVGNGPEESAWKKLALIKGISHAIHWVSWVDQQKLSLLYNSHDIFLFPSLHDSSGNVVLESLAHSLPVLCLDLGGPSVIVNPSCGYCVPVNGNSEDNIVAELSDFLVQYSNSSTKQGQLGLGALNRAKEMNWGSQVSSIYKHNKHIVTKK